MRHVIGVLVYPTHTDKGVKVVVAGVVVLLSIVAVAVVIVIIEIVVVLAI